MPWTRKKKVLTGLALSLAVVTALIGLAAFLIYDSFTAWRCPPRRVSSLAEIPNVGESLSAWQTVGPVYYRYRPVFGQGYLVVVAGVTSSEAIVTFRAGGRDEPDWNGITPKRIAEVVNALSSVQGFAFRQSEGNLSFRWGVDRAHTTVCAQFDARSGWFVAAIDTTSHTSID
jgi:hypothetical protein